MKNYMNCISITTVDICAHKHTHKLIDNNDCLKQITMYSFTYTYLLRHINKYSIHNQHNSQRHRSVPYKLSLTRFQFPYRNDHNHNHTHTQANNYHHTNNESDCYDHHHAYFGSHICLSFDSRLCFGLLQTITLNPIRSTYQSITQSTTTHH